MRIVIEIPNFDVESLDELMKEIVKIFQDFIEIRKMTVRFEVE